MEEETSATPENHLPHCALLEFEKKLGPLHHEVLYRDPLAELTAMFLNGEPCGEAPL